MDKGGRGEETTTKRKGMTDLSDYRKISPLFHWWYVLLPWTLSWLVRFQLVSLSSRPLRISKELNGWTQGVDGVRLPSSGDGIFAPFAVLNNLTGNGIFGGVIVDRLYPT